MRSGSPSALLITCFSHTFSTNVFGLSISTLPVFRDLVSLSTIVDREPVIFVSTPDPFETGLPEPEELRPKRRVSVGPHARERGGQVFLRDPCLTHPVQPPFPVERLLLGRLAGDLIRVDEIAAPGECMVDSLEQFPLVAMREMVDRERRHHEIVTSFCSGQRLARVIHGPKLETALFPREAPARHPEHLHREVNERHLRPRKPRGHHRAKEPRPGPKVENPDLLFFSERETLQYGPVEAVETGHELPPGPVVVPCSLPEQSPDRHADLLAIMFKRT